MAAHLESKGCSVLDQTGLAQKGGAVVGHVRIAARPGDVTTTRIANGAAGLVLGCDKVVTAGTNTRATMRAGKTAVVVNSHETMIGDFTRDADLLFPAESLMRDIEHAAGARQVERVDATRLATALTGDAIATLDPFGYTRERRRERAVASLLDGLDHSNRVLAVEIASLPERIRGFGHMKAKRIEEAQHREAELLERFSTTTAPARWRSSGARRRSANAPCGRSWTRGGSSSRTR